jgi:hypothetical protein
MKKISLIALLCAVWCLTPGCEKNREAPAPPTTLQDAVITDYDLTLCACCGGFFIKIQGVEKTMRFYTLPEGSNLELLKPGTLPLNVRVKWRDQSPRCREDLIEILQIEKR